MEFRVCKCSQRSHDPTFPEYNILFYSSAVFILFHIILHFYPPVSVLHRRFHEANVFFHFSLYSSSFLFLFHLQPFNVLQCGISRSKIYFILIFCLFFFFYQPRNVLHRKILRREISLLFFHSFYRSFSVLHWELS